MITEPTLQETPDERQRRERLEALQEAHEEAEARAAAASWRQAYRPASGLSARPEGQALHPAPWGSPAPPLGRPGGQAEGGGGSQAGASRIGLTAAGELYDVVTGELRSGAAAPPPPLRVDLASYEHLSPAIERRRRALLLPHRNHWKNRRDELAAELAAYRTQAEELTALAAAAEAAELWRELAERRRQLAELAAELTACESRYAYAKARFRSLTSNLSPRLADCRRPQRWIRCACDERKARPVDRLCGQRAACAECRKRWAWRQRRRMLNAAPVHLEAARKRWGRARARLITLSLEHSGDVARDRSELMRGWEQLRKQMHRWFGAALPFALLWEQTPGTDGLGHVHAHVVVIGGPSFWNYGAFQRTWRRACPRSSHLDIQVAGKGRRDPAKACAEYVCKYATKGAVIGGEGWSDELVAQTIAASYGKRWVTTSERFWVPLIPTCPCCGETVYRAAAPAGWYRLTGAARGVLGQAALELSQGPPVGSGP